MKKDKVDILKLGILIGIFLVLIITSGGIGYISGINEATTELGGLCLDAIEDIKEISNNNTEKYYSCRYDLAEKNADLVVCEGLKDGNV